MESTSKNRLFEEIFIKYQAVLYRACMREIDFDPALFYLVDETIQEAYIRAMVNFDKFSSASSRPGWLVSSCKHIIRSKLRMLRRRQEIAPMTTLTKQAMNVAQLADDLSCWILKQEANEIVTEILQLLSDKEKVVFQDYVIDGLTLRQTEEKNHMTHDAVHGILARIRRKSRRLKNFFSFFLILQTLLRISRTI